MARTGRFVEASAPKMAVWPIVMLLALATPQQDPPQETRTFDVGFGEDEPPEDDALPEGDAPDDVELEEAESVEDGAIEDAAAEGPETEAAIEDVGSEGAEPEAAIEEVAVAAPRPGPDGALVLLVPTEPERWQRAHHIAEVATERLARRLEVSAVSYGAVIGPNADQVAATAIASARASITSGIRAFESLDLENAGAQLEIGVNQLLSYARVLSSEDRAVLDTAVFAYAATMLFEGQSELADAIFVGLALATPDFSPTEGRYPSNVVERFAEIANSVGTRATGTLRVETLPAGAAVYVDGTLRGYAPLDVGGLAEGWHQVTADRIGYYPFGTLGPVRADATSSVELELEPSDALAEVEALSPLLSDDLEAVRALRDRLGVATLAVLRYATPMSGDKVEGILLEGDAPPLRIGATAIVADPEVASKTILDAFDRARAAAVKLAVAPTTTKDPEVTEQWWFWAAVGGAVVLAAAAGTAAVVASGSDGPPSNRTVVLGF